MQLERSKAGDGWVALGVSVVGTSHLMRDAPCQDAHAGVRLEDGTLLLAVADGAGSARLAAEGAVCAARTAVGATANSLREGAPADDDGWRETLRRVLVTVQERLAELAAESDGAALRDLATTLLLVAVTPETVATLQVGDGAIVLRAGEDLHVLSPAAVGEYVGGSS